MVLSTLVERFLAFRKKEDFLQVEKRPPGNNLIPFSSLKISTPLLRERGQGKDRT